MKEKVLLFTDRTGQQSLQNDIELIRDQANNLIHQFEAYQEWQRIKTVEDWIDLVTDPVNLFDEVLLRNVNFSAVGGKLPNPETVATIFNIDRKSFIEKTQKAISLSEFQKHEHYLIFQDKRFVINEAVINEAMTKFNIYIESEVQQKYYDHWKNLCDALNEHSKLGYVGPVTLGQLGQACGFRFVPDLGKLFLDDQKIQSEISKIQ